MMLTHLSRAWRTPLAGSRVDADERPDHHRRRPVHNPDPADAFGSLPAERILGNARPGMLGPKKLKDRGGSRDQISSTESELNFVATQTAALSRPIAPASAGVLLPAFTLWWREIVRFYRQKTRVVGVLASPLVFWVVIGSGFGTSFRSAAGGPGQQTLPGLFLSRRADHDRPLHVDLHHDVGDRGSSRKDSCSP